MSWKSITRDSYNAAMRPTSGHMLTELIPELGKATSPQTIASRKFYGIFEPLSKRFPNGHHHVLEDVGCSPGKYHNRLYVQHDSGAVFCLGTYFLFEWRIHGSPEDRHLIADLCAFVGIPASAYDQDRIRRLRTESFIRAGLVPEKAP